MAKIHELQKTKQAYSLQSHLKTGHLPKFGEILSICTLTILGKILAVSISHVNNIKQDQFEK